jgi:cytochrome c oxidase assembly protein subunit 15
MNHVTAPSASTQRFRRLCLLGTVIALCVVVLGAWVRLSHAGLGCPDWPGCYGHLTAGQAAANAASVNEAFPDRPVVEHKAFREMFHRYLAGGLVLVILAIAVLALVKRDEPTQPRRLPAALVLLVVFQALLGMWTVTLLLKPLIVVAHLVGGMSVLALLWWLALPSPLATTADDARLRRWATAGLVVLALQIMLGGWVSSNYSALACPDFPTCQKSFWPGMDFKDAFVLWRGLGIDYEGGVLDHPARVAIHFTHRIGAVVAAIVLAGGAFLAIRKGSTAVTRRAGAALAVILCVQLVLGPTMVLETLPLELATAHNGVAALLLLAVVAVLRFVTIPARSRPTPTTGRR